MSSQINGFKIVRAVSGVSSIQQSMRFFNRCYPVRFHSYFKWVGSLFPFQACLLVQVGCTGLANIWSKTGVVVAEGQIHGEQEEVKGDQYLILVTTSKCSMCSDHMPGGVGLQPCLLIMIVFFSPDCNIKKRNLVYTSAFHPLSLHAPQQVQGPCLPAPAQLSPCWCSKFTSHTSSNFGAPSSFVGI